MYLKKRKIKRFLIVFSFLPIIIPLYTFGASLNLEWTANSEADLCGYKIYYGISPGTYGIPVSVGKVTSYQLSGLTEGVTYYLSLTAYDTSNNESKKTSEAWGVARSSIKTSTTTTNSVASTSSSSTSSSTLSTTTTTIMPSTTSSVASTTSIPATTSIVVTSSVPITTSIPVTSTITPSTTSTVHLTTTTTIPADTTPPNGTITINNSDAFTGVTQVTLKLFATDNARELNANALMTFSNDKQKWSSPEPYSTSKLWTLSPEAGVKTIYVKFRDASGNWMPKPAKDQITLFTSKKLKPTSVTASSEFLPFWLKTQAIDEKTLTLWSTAPTTSWNNEFITLDFGTTKLVEKIDMYASHLFNLDFFPVNFKIEASTNNTTWSTISTEQDYTLKSVSPDSWDFNSPAEARYLRIAITKAKTFFIFHLAQIAEIEVYGTDLPNEYPSLPETPPPPADETSPDNSTSNEVVSDNTDTQGLLGVPGKPLVNFY